MSKELSKEQITELFAFVEKKHVRYKDVQFELVDHLASAIEEEMNTNNELDFESALKEVYSRFPITGFDKFLREKEKAMLSYWRRKIGSILKQYFSLPKLVLTFMIFFLYSSISHICSHWGLNLVIILSIVALINMVFKQRTASIKYTTSYLVLDKFYQLTSGSLFIPLSLYPWMKNALLPYGTLSYMDWQLYLASFIFTFLTIHMHASIFEFPKIIKQEIENKYSHLDIRFS